MPYTDAITFIIAYYSNPYAGAPSVQKNKEAPELMLLLMQIKVFHCFIVSTVCVIGVITMCFFFLDSFQHCGMTCIGGKLTVAPNLIIMKTQTNLLITIRPNLEMGNSLYSLSIYLLFSF